MRKFEFHMRGKKADLNYAPCKGQVVVAIRGDRGTALVKEAGSKTWSLPSGRIAIAEEPAQAAKRVAKEVCGISIRRLELAGIYDVTWHYFDVSIKRLHVVYAADTDDVECSPGMFCNIAEAKFFADISENQLSSDLMRSAVADCSTK